MLFNICDISKTSVKKFLKKNHFTPYKYKLLHELREGDPNHRRLFFMRILENIERMPNFIKNICFTDEAAFFLNGNMNKQQTRYWSDANPHVFREVHT